MIQREDFWLDSSLHHATERFDSPLKKTQRYCGIGDKRETWVKERATGAVYSPRMWKKLFSEQLQNVQYNRYNLSWGHNYGRAVSGTAVKTALVYYCIVSGLYPRS
jgi:hypothetical protein